MPQFDRIVVHDEGVALIRERITFDCRFLADFRECAYNGVELQETNSALDERLAVENVLAKRFARRTLK